MLSLFSFVDFFSFMCIVLEVWTSDLVHWDKEDVSTVDKEDGSSVGARALPHPHPTPPPTPAIVVVPVNMWDVALCKNSLQLKLIN